VFRLFVFNHEPIVLGAARGGLLCCHPICLQRFDLSFSKPA
jgi:hypothetical protein